jgi:hypothetical protein
MIDHWDVSNPYEFPSGLRALLAGQLSRGELVLFTGAGFSLSAPNRAGGTVPSVQRLSEELWAIAFPDDPFETNSTVGDLFGCAITKAGKATSDLFNSQLRVQGPVPEAYTKWYSIPWMRMYTLNVDDLDFALDASGELPVPVKVVSAISDGFTTAGEQVLSVHLNGTLEDYPNVTFSPPQYGERLARPDSWYQQLVRDLMACPVIFVGTELNEPSLWQHLELRGPKGPGGERRPRSYLVCPSLPAARRAILRTFNVEWIPLGQEEFVNDVLWPMAEERQVGAEALARKRAPRKASDILSKVSELRRTPTEDPREFLLGRQPEWADLSDDGYAIVRAFESDLAARIDHRDPTLVVLTGTAGCGKSTTLMRVALQQHALGRDIRWLELEDQVSLGRITQEIRSTEPAILMIDDLSLLGQSAGVFLAGLVESCPRLKIMVAIRSLHDPQS